MAYVLTRIMPIADIYNHIEWPVVVLLGLMIPLGSALKTSGGTELISNALIQLTNGLPAWAILTVLMIVTMTLSDVLNNTATAIVAAPVGIQMVRTLEVSPDPFLMTVAAAASTAFPERVGFDRIHVFTGQVEAAFVKHNAFNLSGEFNLTRHALILIRHKNNTLVPDPGGYHFGDYWRMGLSLEILAIAVSIPAILVFWPL